MPVSIGPVITTMSSSWIQRDKGSHSFGSSTVPRAGKQFPSTNPGVCRLGVAVETRSGAAVEELLRSNCTVFPVQPKAAARYRERKAPSGVKNDELDAWALADALRLDGRSWRALVPEDPMIQELRLLCRDEVALIQQRTALVNQLRAALREYYDTALQAFEDWTLPGRLGR